MRTVDLLIRVRELFADKNNWTTGRLASVRSDGTACFCSLGGILKEGGALKPDGARYQPHPHVLVSQTRGLIAIGTEDTFFHYTGDPSTQGEFITGGMANAFKGAFGSLESEGVHVNAILGAERYLQAAINQLRDHTDIWEANDVVGYEFMLRAFDLAIKNAKRRHINGKRFANRGTVEVSQ